LSPPKSLFIITETYPYGTEEVVFLSNELKIVSRHFEKVVLIPMARGKEVEVALPDNVKVVDVLADNPPLSVRKLFFSNLLLVSRIIRIEVSKAKSKAFVLGNLKELVSVVSRSVGKADLIMELLNNEELRNGMFYSFWMNNGALILSILKYQGAIDRLVYRVHGFDLYEERWPGNHIPFRYFNMLNTDTVFTVSEAGKSYLTSKDIFPEKVRVSYMGIFDNGTNPFDPEATFTIVSCSDLVALKRVRHILDILRQFDFEVQWHHFGEGTRKDALIAKARIMPDNVSVKFWGYQSNGEIMEWYRNNSVNLFINVSEFEGLPVSLMEAISFGIPCIATDCGGVKEIINDSTGILIPVDFEIEVVAGIVTEFRKSNKNTVEYREGVRNYWKNHFDGEQNYERFARELIGNRDNQ